MCSISIPATLKRRRTAFSTNVAHYASQRTALFIATFGSCDVMPCGLLPTALGSDNCQSQKFIVGRIVLGLLFDIADMWKCLKLFRLSIQTTKKLNA